MCIKLGMLTVSSTGSHVSHLFSASQNNIIKDMPSTLSNALKKFGANGHFNLYATCPSCSCNHKALPLPGSNLFDYPSQCTNEIVGKHGVSMCRSELLMHQCNSTVQPIKPYLVSSLPDYLTHCLSNETYLQQSINATDSALQSIRTGEEQLSVWDMFEADFIREFKGSDGKLFIDQGDKIHLAFSIHMDLFNPNSVTQCGTTQSFNVISCANLALDSSILYLPEYLFVAAIIPGPNESLAGKIDHFVCPVIEQFV
ncbi:hypothetical protein GYMLUDRAFT_63756 [Collybiopsis luxurians FD-317 M1]|uniref:Uncharacterized protein n=1 Tax=Collybiopsis luxurians FD-317 M1 TaxID=944289 RepID=A0A0D0CEH3_9AGAR|nr:hypothetical protein GYMLUDRAFT_63756 [Collybiopsis luxurians FD-317 M1]